MAAIFNIRHIQTSDSIPTNLSVLLNLKKHGYNRWNFVAIMYSSLDIQCVNVDKCISGLTAAILNFWVISTCVTIDKDFLAFTQQKTWHTTLFYSATSRISGLFTTCYHIAYFRWISPMLLIWRHAYWGHVMLRSWNWCCPVENLFVHKVIKDFCHISSDKKVTQQRVLWGYFSPHLQH